jgi:signal transduction histidine kinase
VSSDIGFGLHAAWSVTALALAVFFFATFAYRRREVEFLIFGLGCAAMSMHAFGMASEHVAPSKEAWHVFAMFSSIGVNAAAAFNLHFVTRYVGLRLPRTVFVVLYGFVGLAAILILSGLWWEPDSFRFAPGSILGLRTRSPIWTATPVASFAYVVMVSELIAAFVLLVRARLRGLQGAGWVSLGMALILAAGGNDLGIILGFWSTLHLGSMTFVAYAVAVGITLPARYGAAAAGLVRAQEDLETSNAQVGVFREQLETKAALAALGELSATVAHEVRNPLAIIINACASLRRPAVSAEDHGVLLKIIEEESHHLNQLVTDLLRFARPISIERGPVELRGVLEPCVAGARDVHGMDISFSQEADLFVSADRGLLPSVFKNLLDNACEALASEPSRERTRSVVVTVAEQPADDTVRVTVEDSGPGMDQETRRRAKDPFFTKRPSGSGLGLAIVERIVSAHDGHVEITSELGVGTQVSVVLSRANSAAQGLGSSTDAEGASPQIGA